MKIFMINKKNILYLIESLWIQLSKAAWLLSDNANGDPKKVKKTTRKRTTSSVQERESFKIYLKKTPTRTTITILNIEKVTRILQMFNRNEFIYFIEKSKLII